MGEIGVDRVAPSVRSPVDACKVPFLTLARVPEIAFGVQFEVASDASVWVGADVCARARGRVGPQAGKGRGVALRERQSGVGWAEWLAEELPVFPRSSVVRPSRRLQRLTDGGATLVPGTHEARHALSVFLFPSRAQLRHCNLVD
jgi:hypothetical protein